MIRALVSIAAAACLAAPTVAGPPPCTFTNDVTYDAGDAPRYVAVGDLDGDLDLDLAVAKLISGDVSILLTDIPHLTCARLHRRAVSLQHNSASRH